MGRIINIFQKEGGAEYEFRGHRGITESRTASRMADLCYIFSIS